VEHRDIEIFLTLAEELHFGRTAERLRVSPARITQAIKKQERQIGAVLFERTNRTIRLTPLGRPGAVLHALESGPDQGAGGPAT
jgi:DNA-binding transcriptional LysR family regulator